jgi:hypothetical protein
VLAAAYRRQKGDFIAGVKWRAPCSELPIARGHQGGAILLKVGITSGVFGEEGFDVGVALHVERFLGAPGDFFQAAKEQNFDADGLGSGRHMQIVTRVSGSGQWQE